MNNRKCRVMKKYYKKITIIYYENVSVYSYPGVNA